MSIRDYTCAIERERDSWPGVSVEYANGSKHGKVILGYGDRTRFLILSASPSDSGRGLKNLIGDMRRALRELGAERDGRR